jgi:hypothetical protein
MLTFRPLISKDDILRAYNPNKPDSDSAFRRLRKERVISDGLVIRPRSGGRQRGTIAAFYALNEDAAIAYRHGHVELARALAARSAKAEDSGAARAVASAATVVADLEGVYSRDDDADRRRPLDVLAERAANDRRKFGERLGALGLHATLARVVALHDDAAELRDQHGSTFLMPRTPQLIDLAAENTPVTLRSDLMNGVLMTFVEKAYVLPDEDPFADFRPPHPENLRELLDAADLPPVRLTGPGLRWA